MSDDAHRQPASGRSPWPASVWPWIGLLLLVALTLYFQQPEAPPVAVPPDQSAAGDDSAAWPGPAADVDRSPAPEEGPRRDGEARREDSAAADPTRIENVTIRDRNGQVEFRGTVNLAPTIARIERGDRLRFAHDGSTFGNRERRLPHKPGGYYHEYVHPTPGISGPGPQRVIVGREGEIYYTFDHYQSFRRIK